MKYLDMTSDNTTLNEDERDRVNNNTDDLEKLLANRDNEAPAMMEDLSKREGMMAGEEVISEE